MSDATRKLFAALASLDWPKLAHMTGALARELRGDGDAIVEDSAKAARAGKNALQVFEKIGRAAADATGAEQEPKP